ncbi:TNF receptor-associated factor 4-like [Paramuricea clavata]|uniref:TNF receptor-associated factor 4-like n=1 Tax=Paramuricea clavata TaxID=317549 RepID=A0A7D9J2J9_PARCT|nr:TNF receptor-associated factor 4-like [Paramuricea clavata]
MQFPRGPLPHQEPEADYTWKIANFTRKLAQAKSNNDCGDIESEPFFSSHGYKMKLEVYLNEGPRGHSGYMGVYICLMKSDRDGALPWPFTKRYTFVLVDQQDDLSQRQNITYSDVPEGEKEFKRPRQRENVGCGENQFVKHSTLRTRQYIRDHAVYMKIIIDP